METSLSEQLRKRIQELEAEQASLKQELCKLTLDDPRPDSGCINQEPPSISSQWSRLSVSRAKGGGSGVQDGTWSKKDSGSSRRFCDPSIPRSRVGNPQMAKDLAEQQYLNILQSMGQSVYVFDSAGQVLYWNRSAEILYGYSVLEVLGQNVLQLLTCDRDKDEARRVINMITLGETWSGTIPVMNKLGRHFAIFVTNSPFYDDEGNFLGIVGVVVDSQSFLRKTPIPSFETCPISRQPKNVTSTKNHINPQKPPQVVVSSKIWIMSGLKTNENTVEQEIRVRDSRHFDQGFSENVLSNHTESATSSEASSLGSDKVPREFSRESGSDGLGKIEIHKIIASRAESWIKKKRTGWSWKGSELDVERTSHGLFYWINCEQEDAFDHQKIFPGSSKPEFKVMESNGSGDEASASRFSTINSSCASSGQCGTSTSSCPPHKFDIGVDPMHYDIPWEDLKLREQIGRGSCGIVYHGFWCGSVLFLLLVKIYLAKDVAVKVFSKLDYSDDLLHSFRQEVLLMKRLRHPNVLLFMGAVTSHQHLCIVTEFLPRLIPHLSPATFKIRRDGSLFQLLKNTALDWGRRVLMALDIARGMNYLHLCNPPIVHRDLKSSNLLVDKNWTVKVGDFGLSRIKHATFLTTKSGNGTPQWMAPEVMRDEPSDEKSDVYSFGVILWELATQKIPWDTLNSFQVIETVGYMGQHLEIPEVTDPHWVSLIEICWNSEPKCRPTFKELLEKLKVIQKHYAVRRPEENNH